MAERPPSPMPSPPQPVRSPPQTRRPAKPNRPPAGPIVPPSFATSSRSANYIPEPPPDPVHKRCLRYIYNKDDKTFCERTCKNWIEMIVYALMYFIFLATYTMILLYVALVIIRNEQGSPAALSDFLFLTYDDTVGLTATPAGVDDNYPLIWYRIGEANEYGKYVSALDNLLLKQRRKRQSETQSNDLGPCGKPPYGYGEKPCIVLRINKQMSWAAKPLSNNSTVMQSAPEEVQKWVRMNPNKYWLFCNGYHSYDQEHIGNIKYYPYPPGFDSELYPINMNATSPLVAIQVSNFTLGVSLAIECKLWYETGFSSVEFMIYVSPRRFHRNNSAVRY